MKAHERENQLYLSGKRCGVSIAEEIMFNYLDDLKDNNLKVADLGGGTGDISLLIEDREHKSTLYDFSDVAIQIAQENGLEGYVCDLDEGIPADDRLFDIVWAGDVIEHVFDPLGLISEVSRILKDSGKFLFTVPYDLHMGNRIRSLRGISYQEPILKKYGQCKHHTFVSDYLVDFMLKQNKLKLDKLTYICRIPKTSKQFKTNMHLKWIANTMVVQAKKA